MSCIIAMKSPGIASNRLFSVHSVATDDGEEGMQSVVFFGTYIVENTEQNAYLKVHYLQDSTGCKIFDRATWPGLTIELTPNPDATQRLEKFSEKLLNCREVYASNWAKHPDIPEIPKIPEIPEIPEILGNSAILILTGRADDPAG
ncbi:hypothetical protein CYMTET_15149 [Cymbomonas tetramitiformis]|uniref:Uncharacterized protein n=1 Tax=Cymbomonas tetramitiformis TaxID=36881 RepID=A0AAE0GF31_9CHLO|nr:hypothetical protein CYMTET_15149 [Cymbomonas tetramitiformis]